MARLTTEITADAILCYLQGHTQAMTENRRLAEMLASYDGCDSDETTRETLTLQLQQTMVWLDHELEQLTNLIGTVKIREAEAEAAHARCLEQLALAEGDKKTSLETQLQCIDNEWDSYQSILANIKLNMSQHERLHKAVLHAQKVLVGIFVVNLAIEETAGSEMVTCRNLAGDELLAAVDVRTNLTVGQLLTALADVAPPVCLMKLVSKSVVLDDASLAEAPLHKALQCCSAR